MVFASRNVTGLAADLWWLSSAGEGLPVCFPSSSSLSHCSCLLLCEHRVLGGQPLGAANRGLPELRGFWALDPEGRDPEGGPCPGPPCPWTHRTLCGCLTPRSRHLDCGQFGAVLDVLCAGASVSVFPGGFVGLGASTEACVTSVRPASRGRVSECCVLASACRVHRVCNLGLSWGCGCVLLCV